MREVASSDFEKKIEKNVKFYFQKMTKPKNPEKINRFLDAGQTVFDFGESFKNPEILCSILKNMKTCKKSWRSSSAELSQKWL